MIPLGILASSIRIVLPDELLAPVDIAASLVEGLVKLSWTDRNTNETGHRIYRSSSPMDTQALPPPVAELGPDVTEWEDTDTPVDQETYYIVSAVRGAEEAFSDEVMIDTTPIEEDPYWDNVVALLHFDDNLLNEAGLDFDHVGLAPIFKDGRFGGALGQTYGTTNYVSRNVNLDSPVCTIEAYVKQSQTSQRSMVFNTFSLGSPRGGAFLAVYSNEIRYQVDTAIVLSVPYSPSEEFSHVALVLNDGVVRLFIDGELKGEASSSTTIGDEIFYIDTDAYNRRNTGLIIDEFRITKGVARYTENFPPPTEPFPSQ